MVERKIRRCALCVIIGLDERALTRGFRLVVCMHGRNKGTNTIPDWSSSIGQWMMELHRQWRGGDKSKEPEAKILDPVASGNLTCKEWLQSLMDYVKRTDASGVILRDIAHRAKGLRTQQRYRCPLAGPGVDRPAQFNFQPCPAW